jgi:hypothetical protein
LVKNSAADNEKKAAPLPATWPQRRPAQPMVAQKSSPSNLESAEQNGDHENRPP